MIRSTALGACLLHTVTAFSAQAAPSDVCVDTVSEIATQAARDRSLPVDREIGYVVDEIVDGVHFVSDGSFSMAIVESEAGLVLIDAPTSLGPKIEAIAASISDTPITHVIYTHGHADHIGGAANLTSPVTVMASVGATAELSRVNLAGRQYPFGVFVDGGAAVPSPTVIVDGTHTLKLGSRTIRLDTLVSGHSHGDMVAYLPEEKVIVAVDFTWPASAPWVRLGSAVNVPGLIAQNEELLNYDFEHLVAGHFSIVGTRADVEATLGYLGDLREASIAALESVTVEMAGERLGSFDTYPLMDTYLQMLTDAAAAPVMAEWGDRLQGVGTWTCEHASKMISSLRFDEVAE